MGSTFKRKTKKPDGTVKLSKRYYITFRDATGRRRMEAAFVDKSSSVQLLAKREREAQLIQAGLANPFQKHLKTPLSEHLKDFKTYLRQRGVTKEYLRSTISQVTAAFKHMEVGYPGDLSPEKAERFLLWLIEDKGVSRKTRNDYLSAIRHFAKWGIKRGRWPNDPFETLGSLNTAQDIRRVRKPLNEDELSRLIEAAEARPIDEYLKSHPEASEEKIEELRLIGKERGLLYRFAALTGLRRNEIKTLTWANLDLDSEVPTVTVEAKNAKSRRRDSVVMQVELAEDLKAWRAESGRDAGDAKPVFYIPKWTLVKNLRKDCEAAGIEIEDSSGRVIDFHSFRHTTATLLSRANVSPRAAQAHLRHSDIRQTMKTYTHLELLDRAAAAEALPSFSDQSGGGPNRMPNLLADLLARSGPAGQLGPIPGKAGQGEFPEDEPVTPFKKTACGSIGQELAQAGASMKKVGPVGLEPTTR